MCLPNDVGLGGQSLHSSMFRQELDAFRLWRNVLRVAASVRPKCCHRCASLKKSPMKVVLIPTQATKISAEQTSTRMKSLNIARFKKLRSSSEMHGEIQSNCLIVVLGCTPRGSFNNHATLRRVLRRFSNSKFFLEGFLEGACFLGFQ